MKKILSLCLILMCTLTLAAQSEKKSEINKIKKSDRYIYAEATLPTEEEAYSLAEEMLANSINEWMAEAKKENPNLKFIQGKANKESSKISLPRGNMYRAFVYVAKYDLYASENEAEALLGEYVVLTNEADTRLNELDTLLDEIGTVEQSLNAVIGTPNESEIIPLPVEDSTLPPAPEVKETKMTPTLSQDILDEVLKIRVFDDIQPCLVNLKNAGKVTNYNKFASVKNPDDYYMIVYNREGNIEAILDKGKSNSRLNLVTNKEDATSNYKGCGAICFQTKK